MKVYITLLLMLVSVATGLTSGGNSGSTCGGSSASEGDVFEGEKIFGSEIGCKAVRMNVISGNDGTIKYGGQCGDVDWPSHLSGNTCGASNGDGPADE